MRDQLVTDILVVICTIITVLRLYFLDKKIERMGVKHERES